MRPLCSTSTFASFTTGPSSSWMHSSTSYASSITGPSTDIQNVLTPPSTTSYPKAPSSRFLFTEHEVELLTRNGEEILQLHEHFVKELCMVLEPLGFSRESDEGGDPREPNVADLLQLSNVDEAIRIVSTKFSTEVVFHIVLWRPSVLIIFLYTRRLGSKFTKPFVRATPRLWTSSGKLSSSFRSSSTYSSTDPHPLFLKCSEARTNWFFVMPLLPLRSSYTIPLTLVRKAYRSTP